MSTSDLENRLLALYPALASLDGTARQRILRNAHALRIAAGTTIFDERQRCHGLPLLLEGSIRVVKCSPNGRELPLYRVTPGETCIITSSCLLGSVPYNARGIAEGEVSLLLLPETDFAELLQLASFRDFVFKLFAERMADLMGLVEEVAFRKLDQRLAALLLGKGRVLHVTHQQLADELGSVREIVSRLLKGFASQELVSLSREHIEILDAARLRRVASGQD